MNEMQWDELHQAEDPAVELLKRLGYHFIPTQTLYANRASPRSAILYRRLSQAIRQLNPWINEENLQRAVRSITQAQAASLLEANEQLHTLITHGTTVKQDLDDGLGDTSRTVQFIDFDHPERNELIVTRQFSVQGPKREIIFDVVVFVNGLPLAIIECKSPKLSDPITDGITQLDRYQELSEKFKGLGAPRAFEAAQILIVAAGSPGSRHATVGTPALHYARWKLPYPWSIDELQMWLGRDPTPQDKLIYGLLKPENLLDLARNFTVFEGSGGRKARKMARYQQFIAVHKALERITRARRPERRGGVVWHTQGSGKSLTMLWLVLKLRREPRLANPTLVLVTDRTDLDDQISKTFQRCGFPNPIRARSANHLRQVLTRPVGQTLMTTIQKFRDLTGEERHPVLNLADNIFVLVDEAHRTQYRHLAANMRRALPNACLLAFTGTPIDKRDRSTRETFGDYIHTYTILQSQQDDMTLDIYYESRLPDMRVEGKTLDAIFERVFREIPPDDREELKRKYVNKELLAEVPQLPGSAGPFRAAYPYQRLQGPDRDLQP